MTYFENDPKNENFEGKCPLTNRERNDHVSKVLEDILGEALDRYFKGSPFAIEQEEMYENNKWVSGVRRDFAVVKVSFLKSLGRVLGLLIIGAVSWNFAWKFFTGE